MNRIKDKIKEIEKFIGELESSLPLNLEEYLKDYRVKAICERYFEKIIEGITDLAFLIIKEKNFKTPDEEKNVFDILMQENVISESLAEKIKEAKGMRNIIAHEYGRIDDELVFEAVTEQIIKDAQEFLDATGKLK